MTAAEGLDRILVSAITREASDVHLSSGAPPLMRLVGALTGVPEFPEPVPAQWLESALLAIMSPAQRQTYEEIGEVDLAYTLGTGARFRVNIFRQLGGVAAALRLVPSAVSTLQSLGIPAIARDLALKPRGLVLCTGPTGSGKSTTLAAMVDVVNRECPLHIITIEDPIEYLHTSRRALIHQRELGRDTPSFASAMRHILRQDPDVILIGELRDPESISTALTAAETGHLVLSTLHTQGAAKSIDRIIDSFPAYQQNQVRAQLADTLQGVISQTLLPRAQVAGRVLATEVLVHTPAVANLIREGEVAQLYSAMQAGSSLGMHTLDQSLAGLVAGGLVSRQVAQGVAVDPQGLDLVRVQVQDLDAESWTHHADQQAYARRVY
ncbi:type IV pilus twitching motility protein PilT [Propionicicella superfundia]|uniref:type IV pilus twitching motility protein PilT n=1 Tax=Propionicicella superfundia TaxID=348582 RepID=UPI0003F91621|nr:type IV pilus twitching motility protein PilT [Propionicicella superfundia]